MNIFCTQCGTKLPLGSRFCSQCGVSVMGLPPMPNMPLRRPLDGRMVGGVCLAMAQHCGWDVSLVRIITVLCLCCSVGVVGIVYLAGWVCIPEEPIAYPPGI